MKDNLVTSNSRSKHEWMSRSRGCCPFAPQAKPAPSKAEAAAGTSLPSGGGPSKKAISSRSSGNGGSRKSCLHCSFRVLQNVCEIFNTCTQQLLAEAFKRSERTSYNRSATL